MKNSNSRCLKRGFTLWKLVTVVAVLLMGAAILFPMFIRHNETGGHKSSCQNNLTHISFAFKQYINDFDERYPIVAVTDAQTAAGKPPYGWADSLQPYLRNTQVYQCPSDENEGLSATGTTSTPNFTDYWYNANLVRRAVRRSKNKPNVVIYTGANESMFGSSAQTIIAGDGGNTSGTPTGNARYNQCGDGSSLSNRNQICAPQTQELASYPAAKIHLEGANFAFVDGHVKWLRGNNDSQSTHVLSNAATQKSVGGKVTFSILNK